LTSFAFLPLTFSYGFGEFAPWVILATGVLRACEL
jgi:hypothetical protein